MQSFPEKQGNAGMAEKFNTTLDTKTIVDGSLEAGTVNGAVGRVDYSGGGWGDSWE